MPKERIQRILAAAGVASRRACEEMVRQGRVRVNGQVVRQLPLLVDPQADRILVDSRPVRPQGHIHLLLHKPPGVLCAMTAPRGRRCLADLLDEPPVRLTPIGKLETDAGGLVAVTSDTVLAQTLSGRHAGPPRTYRAEVDGHVGEPSLGRLRGGSWVDGVRLAPERIDLVHRQRDRCVLEVTLRGGGHRELSRLLFKGGHRLRRLTCIAVGPLSLRGLSMEAVRAMSPQEVESLRRLAESAEVVRPKRGPMKPSRSRGRPARPSRRPAVRARPAVDRPGIAAGPSAPAEELQSVVAPHAPKRRIILPDFGPRTPGRGKRGGPRGRSRR